MRGRLRGLGDLGCDLGVRIWGLGELLEVVREDPGLLAELSTKKYDQNDKISP